MAESWLRVTSSGPTPDNDGVTAATFLNTGELILAHQYDGVYRGAVSGEQNIAMAKKCVKQSLGGCLCEATSISLNNTTQIRASQNALAKCPQENI